jgi:multidrug efflux pump subunit AcrA (membrane-fusion protein)
MKRYRYLLVAVALGWIANAWASHEIAITEEQMARLGINLASVERATWVASDRMPARVVIPPRQEWVVSAPSGGLVTALHASLGDETGEGEVLAEIQSPGLIALQREFLQALTEMRLASADLKRDRQLFKEGIIAERRYLGTRSRHDQAAATLDERRQTLALAGMADADIEALQRARRLISTLSVHTPAKGVVLETMAVVGATGRACRPPVSSGSAGAAVAGDPRAPGASPGCAAGHPCGAGL